MKNYTLTEGLRSGSKYIIYACGLLLFLCAFLTAVEVILRKFFLISLGAVDELSSYVLAITISWSIAYVLFEKMHIRVDIFYQMLSEKVRHYLDFLSMLINFVFIGIVTYFAFDVFLSSWQKNSTANTPLGTPLWIPQILWFIGFAFFFVVITALLYKSIQNIFSKEKNNYSNIKKDTEW